MGMARKTVGLTSWALFRVGPFIAVGCDERVPVVGWWVYWTVMVLAAV
jgi:hypothetical protein